MRGAICLSICPIFDYLLSTYSRNARPGDLWILIDRYLPSQQIASDFNISPDLAPPTGCPSAVEAMNDLVQSGPSLTLPHRRTSCVAAVETVVGMLAVGSAGSVSS